MTWSVTVGSGQNFLESTVRAPFGRNKLLSIVIRIPPLGGDGEVVTALVGIVNFPDLVLGVFYYAWCLLFAGRVLGAQHFSRRVLGNFDFPIIGFLVPFIFIILVGCLTFSISRWGAWRFLFPAWCLSFSR